MPNVFVADSVMEAQSDRGIRCVLGGCSNTSVGGWCMLKWPTDPKMEKAWNSFVRMTRVFNRSDFKSPHLCCGHFTPDSFTNYNQWVNSFASVLRKNSDAIPSIKVADSVPYFQRRKRTHTVRSV